MVYVESLTERQQEVLGLVAQGFSNKEIAQALHLSVRTVRSHLTNIYSKLGITATGASARIQAVRKARLLVSNGTQSEP